MDIKQPRRILLVGPPDAGTIQLLRDLTGSAPSPIDKSIAGLSHTWQIRTNYYTANLPIWIDEISDVDAWSTDFKRPEAREVVQAVGAWIYVFRRPVTDADYNGIQSALSAIQQVVERAAGYSWDGACLAVATAQSTTPYLDKSLDDWDDMCRAHGFEYIDSEAMGKNEFGEVLGLARITEAIEATDWNGDDEADVLDGLEDDDEQFSGTFAAEEAEMSLEMLGLKQAISGKGQDSADEAEKVDEMERMMRGLLAVKDTASVMPEDEKKRFAKRAVNDLMRTLDE